MAFQPSSPAFTKILQYAMIASAMSARLIITFATTAPVLNALDSYTPYDES